MMPVYFSMYLLITHLLVSVQVTGTSVGEVLLPLAVTSTSVYIAFALKKKVFENVSKNSHT